MTRAIAMVASGVPNPEQSCGANGDHDSASDSLYEIIRAPRLHICPEFPILPPSSLASPCADLALRELERGSLMDEVVSGVWWVLALQGLCALLFGILGDLSPAVIMLWLLVLFAAYALLTGAVAIVGVAATVGAVMSRRKDEDSRLLLLLGLVGS